MVRGQWPRYSSDSRSALPRPAPTDINPKAAAENRVHVPSARIRESELFSELAFEPSILALVQYYWGKPVVLHGTGGTRSEPAELEDRGSNQWHHDGKRKQIRVFLLLTDVPEDGQGTGYVPRSHRIFKRDIVNTRLSEETVLGHGTPVRCTGPAGSIAMIDTNGFHRATRNLGPRRDIWNYSFRAPNPMSTPLNPVPVLHPDVVKTLTEEQRWIARIP